MLLTVSYVLHVLAAGFWTGAVLVVSDTLLPEASLGTVSREGYVT